MQLYISGPSGDAIWYPLLDDTHCAAPMEDENWQDQVLVFSAYAQLLSTEYFNMVDEGWKFPTAEMLIVGEAMRDDSATMVKIVLLASYMLQLSSAMFGFGGFLRC